MSVAIRPGAITLQRMLCRAFSRAATIVSALTAAFAAT